MKNEKMTLILVIIAVILSIIGLIIYIQRKLPEWLFYCYDIVFYYILITRFRWPKSQWKEKKTLWEEHSQIPVDDQEYYQDTLYDRLNDISVQLRDDFLKIPAKGRYKF